MTPLTPKAIKERDIAIEHAISQAALVDDGWIREALELLWQKAIESTFPGISEAEKEVLSMFAPPFELVGNLLVDKNRACVCIIQGTPTTTSLVVKAFNATYGKE